jgi:hypothetical protein
MFHIYNKWLAAANLTIYCGYKIKKPSPGRRLLNNIIET